jgi:hypothetical protein
MGLRVIDRPPGGMFWAAAALAVGFPAHATPSTAEKTPLSITPECRKGRHGSIDLGARRTVSAGQDGESLPFPGRQVVTFS